MMNTGINGGFSSAWQQQSWKMVRVGILIFCLLQIIFEIIVNGGKEMFIMLVANYILSSFFAKNRIRDGKFRENPLMKGMLISLIVFIGRVVLGIFYIILIENKIL